jgi:hypothetical protein
MAHLKKDSGLVPARNGSSSTALVATVAMSSGVSGPDEGNNAWTGSGSDRRYWGEAFMPVHVVTGSATHNGQSRRDTG